MFANKSYQLYSIKCTKSQKIFIGITTGTKANMLNWLLQSSQDDPTAYSKLKESVKEHGINNHTFNRHPNKVFNTKKEGEEYLKTIQVSLCQKGLLLNDSVVNPETYLCGGCNKNIKVIYKKVHDEKYCSASTLSYLDSLVEEVDQIP